MLSLFAPAALSLSLGCATECCEPLVQDVQGFSRAQSSGASFEVMTGLDQVYDGVFAPVGVPTLPLRPERWVAGCSAQGEFSPVVIDSATITAQFFGEQALVSGCGGCAVGRSDGDGLPVWQSGYVMQGCISFAAAAEVSGVWLPDMQGFACSGVGAEAISVSLVGGQGCASTADVGGVTGAKVSSVALVDLGGSVLDASGAGVAPVGAMPEVVVRVPAYSARSYQAATRLQAGEWLALAVSAGNQAVTDIEHVALADGDEDVAAVGWSQDRVTLRGVRTDKSAQVHITRRSGQVVAMTVYFAERI